MNDWWILWYIPSTNQFMIFSCYRSVNFVLFYPTVTESVIFRICLRNRNSQGIFHSTAGRIFKFFSPNRSTNFTIFSWDRMIKFTFFSSHKWVRNFLIFSYSPIIKFHANGRYCCSPLGTSDKIHDVLLKPNGKFSYYFSAIDRQILRWISGNEFCLFSLRAVDIYLYVFLSHPINKFNIPLPPCLIDELQYFFPRSNDKINNFFLIGFLLIFVFLKLTERLHEKDQ